MTNLLLVINAKDMFAASEFQDEKEYYKGALGKKVGTADAANPRQRDWTAGMAIYDISRAGDPRRIGFFPGRWRWRSSDFVRWRALGLCVSLARRFLRLHLRGGRLD